MQEVTPGDRSPHFTATGGQRGPWLSFGGHRVISIRDQRNNFAAVNFETIWSSVGRSSSPARTPLEFFFGALLDPSCPGSYIEIVLEEKLTGKFDKKWEGV